MLVIGWYSLQLSTKGVHTAYLLRVPSQLFCAPTQHARHELTVPKFRFPRLRPRISVHAQALQGMHVIKLARNTAALMPQIGSVAPGRLHPLRRVVCHVALMTVEAGRCFWRERAKLMCKLGMVPVRTVIMGTVRVVQSELGSTNFPYLHVWNLEVKLSCVVGPKSSALMLERPFDSHTLTIARVSGTSELLSSSQTKIRSCGVLVYLISSSCSLGPEHVQSTSLTKVDTFPNSIRLKLDLDALRPSPRRI